MEKEQIDKNRMTPSQLLSSLRLSSSPFKYIPNNIGEIVYCATSNSKEEPDAKEKRIKQSLTSFIICGGLTFLVFLLFSEKEVLCFLTLLVFSAILIYSLYNIWTFKGTDYFVGEIGTCKVSFNGSRTNIESQEVVKFSDCSDLITKEVEVFENHKYKHTRYYFQLISKSNQDNIRKPLLAQYGIYEWKQRGDDVKYLGEIEKQWNLYVMPFYKELLSNGQPISFTLHSAKKFISDALIFTNEGLYINGILFDNDKVKRMRIRNDTIMLEGSDLLSLYFEEEKDLDGSNVNIHMIGNCAVFCRLFKHFNEGTDF